MASKIDDENENNTNVKSGKPQEFRRRRNVYDDSVELPPPPERFSFESLVDFGWVADPTLSRDENLMDRVMLITRCSPCPGAHMGCMILKDDQVLAISVNTPLYQENKSDIHAEVNCIGECAKHGKSTMGAELFVTMPPCRKCFCSIVAAGITRICTRHVNYDPEIDNVIKYSKNPTIELVIIKDTDARLQRNTDFYEKWVKDHGLKPEKDNEDYTDAVAQLGQWGLEE